MQIPAEWNLDPSKLSDYLLAPRPRDDKSKFLLQAGFQRERPDLLESAVRDLATEVEAIEDGSNEYGTFWRVAGILHGPSGVDLAVVAIWIRWAVDGTFHFVTLKPDKNLP